MTEELNISQASIEDCIFTVRHVQVMLDFHLAGLFEVETKRLNEQVKRNSKRFPEDFMFQLTMQEWKNLRSQFATAKRRSLPYVFTEQGVAMLSAVLNSDTAIFISIQIINAFVKIRTLLSEHSLIRFRLEKVEQKQLEADQKFDQLFKALEDKSIPPRQGVFFDGQIFDAYSFTCNLIRTAKQSLILIDNYIDDRLLTLFTKRNKNVAFHIFTKNITKQLQLDLKKHNQQYPPVNLHLFDKAHDRFLIIDLCQVYHFGASLKDLGKKWFAFSKMDQTSVESIILSITRELGK